MLSNTVVKISSLVIVALPAVLIGGEIYSAITGQPATNGFIKIYSVLLMIPGIPLSHRAERRLFLHKHAVAHSGVMVCVSWQ